MPLAPMGYQPSARHWWVTKVTDPTDWDERLVIPEGMHWIVIPPNMHCLADTIHWFPTGKKAIAYVQAQRQNTIVRNLIGALIK